MTISQITALASAGAPWGSPPNGPMYPFSIVFADGTHGQVNSKSPTPPYRVGDSVGYEITGDFRGTPKIKVQKNPQSAPPQQQAQQWGPTLQSPPIYQQPQTPVQQYQAPQQQQYTPPPAAPQNAAVHGQTVGMSINNGVDIALKAGLLPHQPDFWKAVYEYASITIRMAQRLERGELHTHKKSAPAPAPVAPPPPPPPPAPVYTKPQPGPDGSVALDDDNSDIPF